MGHGADWRNPAREAVRKVPFFGDLNHGKIRGAGVRTEEPARIAAASQACGNYSSPSAFHDSD
jgi:hypothetical protein